MVKSNIINGINHKKHPNLYSAQFTILTLALMSCTLISKPNLYERGLECYKKNEYEKAVRYLTQFYKKYPDGDSTLVLLYNCYVKLSDVEAGIKVLEELAKRKNPMEQIYVNLYNYYHQNNLYCKINQMLLNAPSSVLRKFDEKYPLTKRRCAELFVGAVSSTRIPEPINWVINKGFLKPTADGKFYENDTLRINQLILLLDNFIPPENPGISIRLRYIKPDSYLYFPYLRLISLNILEPKEDINPMEFAPLSLALFGITNLKNKGFIK